MNLERGREREESGEERERLVEYIQKKEVRFFFWFVKRKLTAYYGQFNPIGVMVGPCLHKWQFSCANPLSLTWMSSFPVTYFTICGEIFFSFLFFILQRIIIFKVYISINYYILIFLFSYLFFFFIYIQYKLWFQVHSSTLVTLF